MPVVSNTSPLLNLAIVDHLSLMYEQFGEILIPQAVFEELQVEEGLPGSQTIREAINCFPRKRIMTCGFSQKRQKNIIISCLPS